MNSRASDSHSATVFRLTGQVRRRLWIASIIEGTSLGLLVGTIVALLAAIARPFFADALSAAPIWDTPLLLVTGGGIIGLAIGSLRSRSDAAAARLIDEHFDLKDRSITSLDFARSTKVAGAAKQLQLEEAQQHLERVDAKSCVSLRCWNPSIRWALGLAAATVCVLLITNSTAKVAEAESVLPLATQQSNELRQTMLPELEKLAKETDDPEIEKLLEELKEKVDSMDEQTYDENDLMATLSEMEHALAEAREALKVEMTSEMLNALASAIQPSDELQSAAKAMKAEELEKASNELKAADPSQIGDKQRRAVADNLKKMVAKLNPGQIGQLSDSIKELAEGLDNKNMSECKKCLSKLASECKKAGQCKSLSECLSCQLNRLSQCKGECRGSCQSNIAKKSNSPSLNAGKASSGQPTGDTPTKLDSQRHEEMLTGAQGEGPSETEIMQAPEGEQAAARAFKGKYDQFRREAEAVLDSEPLPMGVRETVRTYFEAIRPNSESQLNESAE
ncbi:hypothetical protein [Rhodopirellula sp. MGV]|uniref:hypothetical protein n=1 Tax=Rhodopirellula sp. MGV TaxID=2023130 RepID=UPI000B96F348|nr:hypothetical protein [Rhodopirellula sp. MGV]OYP39223.1 hypothetical protein CGZ80_00175 [Rhodopirellula sp. MGV]PNY35593.1 hypothetical protein C2E31_18670 [Rhodopirellula baltica]